MRGGAGATGISPQREQPICSRQKPSRCDGFHIQLAHLGGDRNFPGRTRWCRDQRCIVCADARDDRLYEFVDCCVRAVSDRKRTDVPQTISFSEQAVRIPRRESVESLMPPSPRPSSFMKLRDAMKP